MRRGHNNHSIANQAATVIGAVLLAGAGVLVLTQLGTLRRYFNMRRMSARQHPAPPTTQARPSGAQTPRWGTSHWPIR